MALFHFGVATEANDYINNSEDQIWVRAEDGRLVLLEDNGNENHTK